jgi:hypothetical protein
MLTSGTCTIQAAQAGNSTYAAATPVSHSFTVNTAAQTITFGTVATQTVGTPLTLSASASSGLPVSLASTTGSVCTVAGNTATMLTSGTCTIQATQAGNISYSAATPVSQTFTVSAASQTITFGTIAAQNVGTPLTLSATATSGLAVSYASTTTSVCTVSGNTATMLTTGTCTIQATQAGNASYLAATPVSQTFTVNGLAQTITFGPIAAQTVGTPLTLSATASSTLAVNFASTTSSVCTVSGTTATMLTSGTCTIQATQPGNSTYGPATPVSQTFTVNGLAQTVTFGAIATQTVGTPLPLSASASSSLTVAFGSTTTSVCTVSGTTATMLTSGTCTIQATQAGNSTYAAATPVSHSFAVNGESQTITFNNPGTQIVGAPLTLSATATSGLAVSFVSTTPVDCSVSGTTATMLTSGTCIIQATQAGNSVYAAATPVSQSFTVNAASQTITFNNPGAQTVGTPLTLSASSTSGLTVSFASTTTSVCTVSGTTATMLISGTCTIQATQTGNASYSAALPVSQSFQVNSAGSQVSGTISLNNNCGSSSVPAITVSINTTPVQTTTTYDNQGDYSFATVPNGTYAITPSITGASSVFYPATQSVTVTNGTVSGKNFVASLGYTVSGTVSYSGAQTGRIYLNLNNTNCGGSGGEGTSIASPGAYSIRGVPPGSYTLQASMDTQGYGAANANDPAPSSNPSVTIVSSSPTGQNVTLTDPAAVSLSGLAPTIKAVSPFNQGVVILPRQIVNSNQVEMPTSYTIQWSTSNAWNASSGFTTVAGHKTVPATGTKGNPWIVIGPTNGQTYYFSIQGVAGSSTSNFSSVFGPVTIAAPTGGNTVTGTVTFSETATGPLYVGFVDQNTNTIYATSVGSQASPPTSPATYTVQVPNGSDYFFFGILDQNNLGIINDPGDVSNTGNGNDQTVTVITGNMTGENLTLPTANSTANVTTQYLSSSSPSGSSTSYSINIDLRAGNKLPVAVTLTSGPNMLNPVDIGNLCSGCGSTQFQLYSSIGTAVPNVGDAYNFNVTYSDTTSETVTGTVTGVLTASQLATGLSPQVTGSTTPTFTWTYPASASSYIYSFYLCCTSNGDIWDIPGNNSNSNGFTSAQIPAASIPWSTTTDPTGANNPPTVTGLDGSGATTYNWAIQVQDSNGNQAQTQVYYIP